MKTRKNALLTVLLGTTLLFAACEKKEVKKEETAAAETHQIVHRYIYEGETHQIEFNYDAKNQLKNITGDVEAVKQFQNQDFAPSAYLVEQSSSDKNTYTIKVFSDATSMNTYQNKEGVSIPTVEKHCTDWTSSGGTANYRFYQHANYVGELNYLTVNNQTYFQRDLWSAENDKITSFKLWGSSTRASLDIFEHGCFSGKTLRFVTNAPGHVLSVPNLSTFTFEICTDVIRDQYGNVYYNSYPCGNWNDKISSLKGWSI